MLARKYAPSARLSSADDAGVKRALKKFRRFFPDGFRDETYEAWERGYKWAAHQRWEQTLNEKGFTELIRKNAFSEIAYSCLRVESRTNLLFSFEKMAIRDALQTKEGARQFSLGLYDFLYGSGSVEERFQRWITAVSELPRKQTRVLTWPVLTVFPFLAIPREHIFLKPNVTRRAAKEYGFEFAYHSKPDWETYSSLLDFAKKVLRDTKDLKPRDMIDAQSFIWVQGSEEYD